jgi:hypothetical protein
MSLMKYVRNVYANIGHVNLALSEKCRHISDKNMSVDTQNLKERIVRRAASKKPFAVWTPTDFLDFGNRHAVDKALQRLANTGELRRIDRGLYDKPALNSLTQKPTAPDYRELINVVSRRDQTRMLIDGMTAANDLGLTDAVPGRIVVRTDARIRPLHLGNLTIEFKLTAPSKLCWAGRPAMRVVQALHWLKDTLSSDRDRIMKRLHVILTDFKKGPAICEDLRAGFSTLPTWMQPIVRDLLDHAENAGEGSK